MQLITQAELDALPLSITLDNSIPAAQGYFFSQGLAGLIRQPRTPDLAYGVVERIAANGEILAELDRETLFIQLAEAKKFKLESVCSGFMHSEHFSAHQQIFAQMAEQLGFELSVTPPAVASWLAAWQHFEQHWPVLIEGCSQQPQGTEIKLRALQPVQLELDLAGWQEPFILRQPLRLERLLQPGRVTLNPDEVLVYIK